MRTPTLPLLLLTCVLAGCTGDAPTVPRSTTPTLDRVAEFPDLIALPNGFAADGISFGHGTTFYVGSLTTGAIWRGDAHTGAGHLLVPPQPGRSDCGLAYDQRTNRLFVAGSVTGQAYVYDAATGSTLGVYQLADPAVGPTDILDVAVLPDAIYFTDLFRPVLYRIPLGPHGELGPQSAVQVLPYSGDFEFVPGGAFNTSGIVATPDGRWLIVVNATTGTLYRVDPRTGNTTRIALAHGGALPSGDGLALVGHTLYVSQVAFNQIAVVRTDADFASGVVDPNALSTSTLDSPTKIAVFGSALYAVNARFEVDPGPDVEYQVVRVSR